MASANVGCCPPFLAPLQQLPLAALRPASVVGPAVVAAAATTCAVAVAAALAVGAQLCRNHLAGEVVGVVGEGVGAAARKASVLLAPFHSCR